MERTRILKRHDRFNRVSPIDDLPAFHHVMVFLADDS
jgi:hypothetical protein